MNYALLPDLINGLLQMVASIFVWVSVSKLHKDKVVRGVSCLMVAYFAAWGFWNLFYYPHLGQWISFWGGLTLVIADSVWFAMILYYLRKERNEQDYSVVRGWAQDDRYSATSEGEERLSQLSEEYARTFPTLEAPSSHTEAD